VRAVTVYPGGTTANIARIAPTHYYAVLSAPVSRRRRRPIRQGEPA
jgi:hypothetical protein